MDYKYFEKEIKAIYDPKTAFGNAKLLGLLESVAARVDWYENTKECKECKGTGKADHDCSCELCTIEFEECPKCDGEGRIEK